MIHCITLVDGGTSVWNVTANPITNLLLPCTDMVPFFEICKSWKIKDEEMLVEYYITATDTCNTESLYAIVPLLELLRVVQRCHINDESNIQRCDNVIKANSFDHGWLYAQ